MILVASQIVVPRVIAVSVLVPVERNHFVVVFHALPREMYCSVYSAPEEAVPVEGHPSALVELALA